MKVKGVSTPWQLLLEQLKLESLPLYEGDVTDESSTCTQRVESESDDSGTVVTEVTTVTTHKKFLVQDA